MIMSYLILKHLSSSDLPAKWTKLLPVGQNFTISIVAEGAGHQSSSSKSINENKGLSVFRRQWKENFFDPS